MWLTIRRSDVSFAAVHECPVDGSPSFGMTSCYWHLKMRLERGGSLTADELRFIGAVEESSASNGRGWRSANELASVVFGDVLSGEDADLMNALMRIGTDAGADFLG